MRVHHPYGVLAALALVVTTGQGVAKGSAERRLPASQPGGPSAPAVAGDHPISFKRTPTRLARGKYLVEGVAHCFECHSELVSTARPVQVVAGKKGAGRVNPRPNANGVQVVFPNITPDMETGAGTWTDEQFERAIRHGIGHDGRTLVANMPYRFFNAMSDEDLASVVVYIRSIPAVRNALPKIVVPPQVAATLAPLPDAGSPPPPGIPVFSPALLLSFTRGEPSPAAKRGAYLATLGQCAGCHSTAKGGQRVPGFAFAGTGGFTPRIPPKGAADTFRIASMNLTPDPSGIPYYDEGVFLKTIRSGAVNGVRNLDTVMPWSWFRNMTESDLKDVFAYLKGLQPVVHHVDNREPPTLCPIDGQMHGFGDHNHVVASTASR